MYKTPEEKLRSRWKRWLSSLAKPKEEVKLFAEEIAKSFMNWVTKEDSPYAIMWGEEKRFCREDEEFTIDEVYKLFEEDQNKQP